MDTKFTVGVGLFTGLVDNKKNTDYHQRHPVTTGFRGSFPEVLKRKEVLVPATSNSPGFGSCLSPLWPPVVYGTFPGGVECKRKASWLVQWSCISPTWEDLWCGTGLQLGHLCGTALPPAQSTEAKGPPLLDGC